MSISIQHFGNNSLILYRLLDEEYRPKLSIQAHVGEINDCAIYEDSNLIISCGRDHMIQVFQVFAQLKNSLRLLQTLNHHESSVNQIKPFMFQGRPLLASISSDRTVVLNALAHRKASVAFVCLQTITLKHTPLSCAICPQDSSVLIISTADKKLQTYDIRTGQLIRSTTLIEDGSPLAMQSFIVKRWNTAGKSTNIVIGLVGKEIGVHDLETGLSLTAKVGQSDGLTDLVILQESSNSFEVVTTSYDGTVSAACRFFLSLDTKSA